MVITNYQDKLALIEQTFRSNASQRVKLIMPEFGTISNWSPVTSESYQLEKSLGTPGGDAAGDAGRLHRRWSRSALRLHVLFY